MRRELSPAPSAKEGRFERPTKAQSSWTKLGSFLPRLRSGCCMSFKERNRARGRNKFHTGGHPHYIGHHRNLEEMIVSGRFAKTSGFASCLSHHDPAAQAEEEDIRPWCITSLTANPWSLSSRRDLRWPWHHRQLIAHDWPATYGVGKHDRTSPHPAPGGVLSFETLVPLSVSEGHEGAEEAGRHRALPSLDEINARHIRRALKAAGGKINGPGGPGKSWASPNTLRKRMKQTGIPFGRRSWHPSHGQT